MISIVIPLYNKANYIANTLKTVFAQTYQDFEVVIVDDGSTDGSEKVVETMQDARIRLIKQQNAGVSAARNNGIAEARGEYIALLDADDEWKPTYLATQMALVEKYPQCDVFCCNYEFRNGEGQVSSTIVNKLSFEGEDGVLTNYFEVASCSHPPICSISIMVRKGILESVGGFPLGIRSGEDLITWAKLACKYQIAYSLSVQAVYEFRSSKQLVTPRRAPDVQDKVGDMLNELTRSHEVPYLKDYAALWHKMRMVTFVRLGMHKEANREYKKIKSYIAPSRKMKVWHYLNLLPHPVLRFVLFQIAKVRK